MENRSRFQRTSKKVKGGLVSPKSPNCIVMPDKEGAEEKTTKSVVSKRQKQMMGEEGYDVARDMGRVRPSKDKKDATSYPPSDEVKKTQKVNKGPSALDIVKKKYKGQIMDVKKEELDLTKVAEAFGGYIVEAPKPGSFEFSRELGPKGKFQTSNIVKRMMQAFPPPGEEGKIGSAADAEVEKQITVARADKKAAQIVGRDKLLDTIRPKRSAPKITGDSESITGGRDRTPVTFGQGKEPKKNVEPEPKKIKKPIRDRNRVLQKVRVAARSTKRPVQRLVKPLGKLAARNPFAAAIVGTDLLDRAGRMIPKPKPPKLDVGVVGRRTAG